MTFNKSGDLNMKHKSGADPVLVIEEGGWT